MSPCLAALLLTLAVEVPVVTLVYLRPGRQALRALVLAVVVNLVTNPFLCVVLRRWMPTWDSAVMLGEGVAVVGEALAYWAVLRPRSAGRALLASGLANLLSFAIGLWVL